MTINSNIVEIATQCPMCRKIHIVYAINKDLDAWYRGANIVDAFPYLSSAQRELLISGIDEDCWNKIFSDDDEEEEEEEED